MDSPEIFWQTIKWVEKIDLIKPEIIQTPDYSYWVNQEPLDFNKLKNKPSSWWLFYTWTFTRNSWSTWNQSITWIWFKPKLLKIHWVVILLNTSMCWGSTDWTNPNSISYNFNWWSLYSTYQTTLIHLDIWAMTRWTLASFDTDWFTINWSVINSNVRVNFECFW